MATRVVEGKKPYTGGKAISIDENKVISLNLRDENNLIIYDSGDDEIYVDLQLPDGIQPLDAFPVGVTTGRVLVADDWDVTGTIICAKTTSGDNIKLLYGDNGTLWIDNGTGTFKQIYFKSDVDTIVQALQTQIDVLSGLGKFLSLWDCETGEPISFPISTPYEYSTGDWFMINNIDNTTNYRPSGTEYDGTASTVVETDGINIGDVYIYDGALWLLQNNAGGGGGSVAFSQILGQPTDNTNLATALNSKQDTLSAGDGISISSNTVTNTKPGPVVSGTAPSSPTEGMLWYDTTNDELKVYDGSQWNATGVEVSTDTGNLLSTGAGLWIGSESDFSSIVSPDSNTMYIQYVSSGGGGWQPGVNTILYLPLDGDITDPYNNVTYSWGVGSASYDTWDTGVQAAKFNGSNAISLGTTLDFTGGNGEITICYWFTTTSPSTQQRTSQNRSGTYFNITGIYTSKARVVCTYIDPDTSTNTATELLSTTTLTANTKYLYTVTIKENGDVKLYLNGQLENSGTVGTLNSLPTEFGQWIGSGRDGSSERWRGMIKDFIVEDRVWTPQEVLDYYNQTV